MANISGKQADEIIRIYSLNGSILETARETGVSTVKVRKILITEGLWESDTSIRIGNLLKEGKTTAEIAEILYMSVKNVQAYMPYDRGTYGDGLSKEAIRSDRYRSRMRQAASAQVMKRNRHDNHSERSAGVKKEKSNASVLKLHIELDMEYADDEERRVLKKYGAMKESISRDILVPGDITLHALNYAILRMFGWQNGHLHNFSLPDDVFIKLTGNKFSTWAELAGVYFRFPTENYDDIYWDDDYREGQSVKTWMKKKYTGPYRYRGLEEHYLINQLNVREMFEENEEITVRKYVFGAKKQPEPYQVKLKDATIDEVENAFMDFGYVELAERLPIGDLICVKGSSIDFEAIWDYLNDKLSAIDIDSAVKEYKGNRKFLEKCNISTMPVTDSLVYKYDYGDGWEVHITCENAFMHDNQSGWKDVHGNTADEPAENLEEVTEKYRPLCIAKDGIELVDDVGGIHGFCEMLETIYESDMNDEDERAEHDNTVSWAEMMGWTGRRISPKQTL